MDAEVVDDSVAVIVVAFELGPAVLATSSCFVVRSDDALPVGPSDVDVVGIDSAVFAFFLCLGGGMSVST